MPLDSLKRSPLTRDLARFLSFCLLIQPLITSAQTAVPAAQTARLPLVRRSAAPAASPGVAALSSVAGSLKTHRPAAVTPRTASPANSIKPQPRQIPLRNPADPADPYIVAQATALNNDPNKIFAFVRDQITSESYTGSVRGARGALWSKAGNSLDKSSLLIALLGAS